MAAMYRTEILACTDSLECTTKTGRPPHLLETSELPTVFDTPDLAAQLAKRIHGALLSSGAIVLRDLHIDSVHQFKWITEQLSAGNLLDYAGGASPRKSLADGIYTSTEYPPEMPLTLHNELSYSAAYPRTLFFFCEVEPQSGGETTLGDSRKILASVDPEIVDLFRAKGVLYVRNLISDESSPYSWQTAFETDDRHKVECVCKQQGSELEWKKNGDIRMSFTGPATSVHRETGEEVWFNQADGFHSGEVQNKNREERPRLESYFGDGSEIPAGVLEHVRNVIRKETIPHKWKKGDLLIVDNILAAHGRMPFMGPRKIVLAMA